MKNRNKFMKLVALLLLLAMAGASLASCDLVLGNATPPSSDDTPPSNSEDGSETKDHDILPPDDPTPPPYDPNAQSYTITYVDALSHNNPTSYTSNDRIILNNASWPGLSFSHWSDFDGNVIKEISYGTTGNITLTANWKITENLAISADSTNPSFAIYLQESGRYCFAYRLGSIYDVVLDELASYHYNGATNHTWSITETVSFTESEAQSVANTVSKSVTSSSSWSSACEKAISKSNSTTTDISSSMSAEMGVEGFGKFSTEMSAHIGKDITKGTSNATSNSTGGSNSSSSESSKSVSSTLSFVTDTSTEIVRSETLTPDISPAGKYKYVQAGMIEVYAIVIYDINAKDYFINIFSYVDSVYDVMLYEPLPAYNGDIHIVESAPFEFDLDIDSLAEDIANAYYIEFDANGGSGTMPTQMMIPNTSAALHTNQFTKGGHEFAGWRVKNGDKLVVYPDGHKISDLGSPKETITLEALWTKDPNFDVVYTATTKSGYVSYKDSDTPECKYSVVIEYRNRTATSVEIKVKWTSTISKTGVDPYRHKFKFNVGSVYSNSVVVVPFNSWKNTSTARSCTEETGWVTIPLNTSDSTTISLHVYYWKENSGGTNMTSNYGYSGVDTNWSIDIPAYN